MNLIVLSRRTIAYRKIGKGEITAVLVPGRDQIQVTKDLAGIDRLPNSAADQNLSKRGPQLSRTEGGLRYIYGYLPDSILELKQSVKVWLAEDFTPPESQAFFYVITSDVVLHGMREQDDEGRQSWRTAQLTLSAQDTTSSLIQAITDYVLSNPNANVCVAVYDQIDLYQSLKSALEPYHITPVPFSMLKVEAGIKPLYRHADHTVIYLTACLFGFILLLATGVFAFLNHAVLSKLERDIQDTQTRIASIQYNQNIGNIRDPQSIINNISKPLNQQPSAILDAAASFGSEFGDLSMVSFAPEKSPDSSVYTPQAGEKLVAISISKNKEKLLFDQELRAQQLVVSRPWIRAVYREGSQGGQSMLGVMVQVDQAPAAPAIINAQPIEKTPTTSVSITQISATGVGSSTAQITTSTTEVKP